MERQMSEEKREWLLKRKEGIGGSDIASICGIGFDTPSIVWEDKTNKDYFKKETKRMLIGTIQEPTVAELFEIESGLKVRNSNEIIYDKEFPYFYANIDRKIQGEDALLECKTASTFMKYEWEEDHIPDMYLYQIQWYLGITGYSKAYIACLIGGNDFCYKVCHRNEELITLLRKQAYDFWNNYVIPRVKPPAIVGDEEFLMKYYEPSEDTVDLTDLKDIIYERDALSISIEEKKKDLKPLEDRIKEIDIQIKDYMQGAEKGECDIFKVSNKIVVSNRVDTKLLKEKYPLVYEEVIKESKSNRFSVKESK